jgi:hypothetical protein
MRSEHQPFARIEQSGAMTRRDRDATLGVKRNDRRSVKRSSHAPLMAVCATFFYLFPLYWGFARAVKRIF